MAISVTPGTAFDLSQDGSLLGLLLLPGWTGTMEEGKAFADLMASAPALREHIVDLNDQVSELQAQLASAGGDPALQAKFDALLSGFKIFVSAVEEARNRNTIGDAVTAANAVITAAEA